jgi:hypothetical protein
MSLEIQMHILGLKDTTDQVAKSTMGQMGSFGVLGGATGANKTLKILG